LTEYEIRYFAFALKMLWAKSCQKWQYRAKP